MDGVAGLSANKKHTLYAALLQAVALYLVYLAVSLTDIWGYLPSAVHVGVYGILGLMIIQVIQRGLVKKSIWSLNVSLKAGFLSVVLLLIAGITAGSDSRRLLDIAVKPRAVFDYAVPEFTMTVIPPSYTGREVFTERLLLENVMSSGLKPIPESSEIIIRATNITYAPKLIADQQKVEFLSAVDGGFVARFILNDEAIWQIKEGSFTIGEWPIIILPDDVPNIERAEFRPMLTKDGLFALSLKLSDDYGLHEVHVGMAPTDGDAGIIYDKAVINVSKLKDFSGDVYINFSASDLAGGKVNLIVDAIDQAGQRQQKILTDIILPAKEFANPHARKLIEISHNVMAQPENRIKLAREIMALGLVPNDGQMPTIYYMALRSAYWRLNKAKDDEDINDVRDILWDLADHLEDGNTSQFKREILDLLANLKLTLLQGQEIKVLRKQLQEVDRGIILFLRQQVPLSTSNPDIKNIDIKELRRIYGKILTHSHNKETDRAIDLISYLEHGFIYQDRGILSEQGYKRFQFVIRARDRVSIFKKTQREVMAFIYKNTIEFELASLKINATDITTNTINMPKQLISGTVQKWIDIQRKLGSSVNDLGRNLARSGVNTAQITVAASDLIRDVINSMEAGNMEAAVAYQSEILTLFNRLKDILDTEVQYSMGKN